jgi:hypothetical protein
MRGFCASALLVVVLFVAGCGGGGSGGSSGSGTSGEAAKPAAQVLADAVKAAEAASSTHLSGQVTASGKQVGLDISLVRGKGATGSMTLHGAKLDLILTGNKAYLRGSAAFWNQFSQASSYSQLLADRWLTFPADNAQLGSFTEVANEKALFDRLSSDHGKLTNQGATTYKGRSVVAVYDTKKGATLYVAASGTPYPVAVVKTKGGPGTITFDRWNQSVTLTAPKGALDLSQLGG